jgi:biotin transport system substrate-specific component
MKKKTALVLTALFAALTAAGCFIQIPLPTGIPIVLQDMMAMLSGLLLGPVYGGLAVFVFIVLGCIGLPVFSGKAGINVILQGPTGGFIISYLLAAIAGGLFLALFLKNGKKHSQAKEWIFIILAALIATVVVFAGGITGFMIITKKTLAESLAITLVPFIPGNLIKIVLMVLLTKKFRPIIYNYTH